MIESNDPSGTAHGPKVSDDFLFAWQEKLRGSAALTKSRLFCYLPFIYPLLHSYPRGSALDLLCGRGDWLELLEESGFSAQGVDTDAAQIAHCQQKGFSATQLPALTALQACSEESHALVSGLGLAETLPFEALQQVVQESLRVLKPGGLLILQTINPDNIVATTNEGFLNPARRTTIPSALLVFLAEHVGFAIHNVVPLQERVSLLSHTPVSILNVLKDPSPFYAVIAQKSTDGMLQPPVISAFEQDYGLTLETLAARFDQQLDLRFKAAAEATQQVAVAAARAEAALAAIHASFTYRMTAPIRWVEQQLEQIQEDGAQARFVAFVEKVRRVFLQRAIAVVTGRRGMGGIQQYLSAARQRQLQQEAGRQALLAEQRKVPLDPAIIQQAYQTRERIETLSPEAQVIYERLHQTTKPNKQPRP